MNDILAISGQAPALLLIDDEVSILKAVERLMTGSHLRVLSFSDPTAAIPHFSDPSVAVIVSDFRMPLFRGTDVLARARKDNKFARRILLSSHADLDRELDGVAEACVHHIIDKPYDPTLLRARILRAAIDARFDLLVGRLPSILRALQLSASVAEVRALLSEGIGVLGAEAVGDCLEPADVRWSTWGETLRQAGTSPDREDSIIELILSAASVAITRLSWEKGPAREPRIDSLTSLVSPRLFETALERERQRLMRYGTPLSIAFVDIDHFDEIEHEDAPLRSLAQILRRSIRSIDVAARRAGRGFAILFPGLSPQRAVVPMRRIAGLISGWAAASQQRENLTTAIGIAQFSTGEKEVESFIARAASAVGYARDHGPNGIAIHDSCAIVEC